MNIRQREEEGVVICDISGEINIDAVSGLKKQFKKLIDKKMRKVLLNFNKVDYIDSLGLAFLVELSKDLRNINGTLFISNVPPKIRSIFSITKLDKVFKIYDTEEEALENSYGY